MTPLTAANVAFSTLEGRPSAFNFEYSPGEKNIQTFVKVIIITETAFK
jgi:hypothetical protein